MRRLTLGVCILAIGTLLALPFRRPTGDASGPSESSPPDARRQILDDRSLQLLVQEVTQDVEIPTAYAPHTDYDGSTATNHPVSLPLTYEDVAVPVQDDPFYEQRFNATAAIASRQLDAPPASAETAASGDSRARRFTSKPAVAPNVAAVLGDAIHARPIASPRPVASPVANRMSGDGVPQLPPPTIGQSEGVHSNAEESRYEGAVASPAASVLSPLPPPEASNQGVDQPRERHWIRQPD